MNTNHPLSPAVRATFSRARRLVPRGASTATLALLTLVTAPLAGCAAAPVDSEGDVEGQVAEAQEALTAIPSNATISIVARANNLHVTAENAGASALIANRAAIDTWEKFQVSDLGGGNVAFRSLANDRYVSADNAGVSPLIALRTYVGPWETFQWIDLGSGDFALKSAANGLYVTAGSVGSTVLIANRTSVGPWEKFHWQSAASSPNGRLATFFRDGVNDAPTNAYGRGVGTVPQTSCGAGYVMDAGLCYPDCPSGYYGVGPLCWQTCPATYTDIGALCARPLVIISADTSACPWYDACCLTIAHGNSVCPAGYANDGCTCRIDASIFGKATYPRGYGLVPTSSCGAGLQMDGGLCYPPCETGYAGVGPVCWLSTASLDSLTAEACSALYDETLSGAARLTGKTKTIGFGVGVAIGATVSTEVGVAYGANGEFGCYKTVCAGGVTDVSISTWASASVMSSFDSVTGVALVTSVGVATDVPLVPIGIGGTVGIVRDTEGEILGTTGSVSFGVGVSPPLLAGFNLCTTQVQQTRTASAGDVAQPSSFVPAQWATQQGGYWDTQQWVAGDFNGDGRTDLAKVFNDGGLSSADVHLSSGGSFTMSRWETQGGAYGDAQKWMAGDFNGDGKADLVNVFNDVGRSSVDVHLSSGNGFTKNRWETQAGGFWDTQKWLVGDFNGDGKADLANVFNDGGLGKIDVHLSSGSSLTKVRWETQSGGIWGTQKWVVGDFDGDGDDDIASIFSEGGLVSIDVHISSTTGFTKQRWVTQQGPFDDGQRWMAMRRALDDSAPHPKADLVYAYFDNGYDSIAVRRATGSTFAAPEIWATQAGVNLGQPAVSPAVWAARKWLAGSFNTTGGVTRVYDDGGLASMVTYVR